MTSREFCYWLQGFFEINRQATALTVEQTDLIRRHLALVFKHEIDPSYGDEAKQKELQTIHDNPHLTPPEKPDGFGDFIARC